MIRRAQHSPRIRRAFLALTLVWLTVQSCGMPLSAVDPVRFRVRGELRSFTSWLDRNDAKGFIGEVGWPDRSKAWNRLAYAWYRDADAASLWVTAWATGEWWGTDYRLAVYEDRLPGVGVDSPNTQARVLSAHPGRDGYRRGVNVSGGEFAAPSTAPTASFSNHDPGTYEREYHFDSQATFDYLASRGIGLVRIPFRWERLQRAPGADLDPGELERLRAVVRRATAAGLRVVIDMHNYGAYYLWDGSRGVRRPIGSPEVTIESFVDVWARISRQFHDAPAVVGYGLMNEPVALPSLGGRSPAELWQEASQSALAAIRASGDHTLVMVPGYGWSGVQTWTQHHPDGWISDPLNRFLYEAHHYFDSDHSGTYRLSYREEQERAGP